MIQISPTYISDYSCQIMYYLIVLGNCRVTSQKENGSHDRSSQSGLRVKTHPERTAVKQHGHHPSRKFGRDCTLLVEQLASICYVF